MLCQLYENIVSQEGNTDYYERYADSLIALDAINEAKNVLHRFMKHQMGLKSINKLESFL